MSTQLDKILIVDDDPEVRSLLREQVLDSRRFEVFEAQDGAEGLHKVSTHQPDLIILDLVMPGLSGADFLVALKAQGFTGPIIVSTKRGSEAQAIDCFRLGASDYLTKPLREAEALRTIEHGLEEVRMRRERTNLLNRLQESNKQLEARLNALTMISSIGKSVTSMLNLKELFERVLEAAVSMTGADHATLMLFDEESQRLILRAGKNMTLVMQEKLGEPVNDEVANLVMFSGESLIADGNNLKSFRVSADLHAVIYMPIVIQGKTLGILTVGNHKKRRAFDENMPSLLEILVGYAGIAIANARLFTALERRAGNLEHAYNELKARDVNRQRIVENVSALHKELSDLQADLSRTNEMPRPLAERMHGLSQRVSKLLHLMNENKQ
ncbi:MAG: response regulator [Chloroflexota bacterium]